jgi:large subunit ribosomal protein L6
MSRVGKKPVQLPDGVSVAVADSRVDVKGPLGSLAWSLPPGVSASLGEDQRSVTVARANDEKRNRALHGLSRSLIANMVEGVSKGFEKKLLIFGTGYSCNVVGGRLELNVGFMGRGSKGVAQFSVKIPDGVEVIVDVPAARGDNDPARLTIKSCDKQKVGEFAADVRKIRPPEPYKGKGIRYDDEHVRRKQGKSLVGGSG